MDNQEIKAALAIISQATTLPEEITLELHDGEDGKFLVVLDGEQLEPDLSLSILRKSPDGFNWGYNGSGPAQLAFGILLHYLPVRFALALYQPFKFDHIGKIKMRIGTITIPLKKWVNDQGIKKIEALALPQG